MKPYCERNGISLYHGDCREVMRDMEAESVQAIITSPPYWMKRKYNCPLVVYGGKTDCTHEWCGNGVVKLRGSIGDKVTLGGRVPEVGKGGLTRGHGGDTCSRCGAWRGELGWEPTPQMFVAHLVEVFAEAHQVLRDDGLLFVNLMDTRIGGGRGGDKYNDGKQTTNRGTIGIKNVKGPSGNGLKPKDMALVPQRFVLAMQEWGWYARSTIIWAKGESFNPFRAGSAMPESAGDRPSDTHEYIFMFSKQPRYYSDMAAVAEQSQWTTGKPQPPMGGKKAPGNNGDKRYSGNTPEGKGTRNLRSVWSVPPAKLDGDVWRVNTRGTSVRHYATWTPELAATMIRMSTKQGDTVLDPFGGSGTTGRAAVELGRQAICIEIAEHYCEIAANQLAQESMILPHTSIEVPEQTKWELGDET